MIGGQCVSMIQLGKLDLTEDSSGHGKVLIELLRGQPVSLRENVMQRSRRKVISTQQLNNLAAVLEELTP